MDEYLRRLVRRFQEGDISVCIALYYAIFRSRGEPSSELIDCANDYLNHIWRQTRSYEAIEELNSFRRHVSEHTPITLDPIILPLERLSSGIVTVEFDTQELLAALDMPKLDELSYYGEIDSIDSIVKNHDLLMKSVDENWIDSLGNLIPEDAIMEIQQAESLASETGSNDACITTILKTLERFTEPLSSYEYKYDYMPDENTELYDFAVEEPQLQLFEEPELEEIELRHVVGTARGIVAVDANYDKTKIITNVDLIHIINDINQYFGWGRDPTLENEHYDRGTHKDFIENHFSALLKNAKGLQGFPSTKIDYRACVGFCEETFRDRLEEIEHNFHIRILPPLNKRKFGR